ncbi:hypothetical protein, partial [Pseudomonas fluorescens]|uniref:hypothetical protein n=1 Tax=Pseudomonas fluorescens TaxID=294 RepID=UPI0037F1F6C1
TFKGFNRDGFTFVIHPLISTIWKLKCSRRTQVNGSAGRFFVDADANPPGTPANAIVGIL